jgi:hypothetical protein
MALILDVVQGNSSDFPNAYFGLNRGCGIISRLPYKSYFLIN